MKRILFFNYEFPPLGGGAANATEKIFQEYAGRDDIMVDLVTSAIAGKEEIVQFADNITLYRVPIGKNNKNLNFQSQKELLLYTWNAFRKARVLMRKNSYDLTHSFFAVPSGLLSLYFNVTKKIPYIVSLRGADVPGYSERFPLIYLFFTPLIRLIWSRADYVVTNSRGLTELTHETASEQEISEIYNGVSTTHFSPGEKKEGRPFTILLAARLTHRKGFIYAIDALEILTKKHRLISMVIAGGDGGVMEKLMGHAQALGIRDRITFTDHYTHDEAPDIYRSADVFVMPSLNEGMSNNALEALASGLPIIMTRTGGAEELVTESENGFLVQARDGEDIARYVEKLYEDPELLTKMKLASRQKALQFTWAEAAEKYLNFYREVK